MRYFILLVLAGALCLPAVAATTPNATTQHKSGRTQWALFSKKNHAPKAKKEHKAKPSKKSRKNKRGAKPKH